MVYGTVEPTMSHVIGSRDKNHWRSRTMLSYDSRPDGICSDGTGSECIGQRVCPTSSICFELEMQGGFRGSKRIERNRVWRRCMYQRLTIGLLAISHGSRCDVMLTFLLLGIPQAAQSPQGVKSFHVHGMGMYYFHSELFL
jgi:hypothetical protein